MPDFDWSIFGSGDYIRLENVGDTAEGNIVGIRLHKFEDRMGDDGVMKTGQTCPVLELEMADGSVKDWTTAHVDALKQLKGLAPQVGAHIKATIIRDLGPGKGKGKLYQITVGAAMKPPGKVTQSDEAPF